MTTNPAPLPSRRRFTIALGVAPLVAPLALTGVTAQAAASTTPRVHLFRQVDPIPVNAYIVEGESGLVVIDATLTNAASLELRSTVDALGKPLRAVLLTHPHPDHYAGLGNLVDGLDVPIVSVSGVNDIVRRDDADKNELIGNMFGDAWPQNRVFPNQITRDGDLLVFDDLAFEVRDIGPAESFHDSLFVLRTGAPQAFIGDIAYCLMHSYMADNTNPDWLRALGRLQQELPADMVLHVGHGAPVTPAMLRWQQVYIELFEATLRAEDWSDPEGTQARVVARMQDYLPSHDLLAFLQLSILPNAQRLGIL